MDLRNGYGGKKEVNKIQASEMRFLRAVKGCRKEDRIGNESVRDELQIYFMKDELDESKLQWWRGTEV
jgi:hypothetical protein